MVMDLTRHHFPAVYTLVFAILLSGCALSPNLTSNLENDEIYLNKDEEFVSDAEYLASAYESSEESVNNYDSWSNPVGISCGAGYRNYGYYGGWGNGWNNGWGNGWNNGWNNGWGNNYYGGNSFYGYDPFGGGYYGYGGYNPYGYSPFGYGYSAWNNPYNNGWGWNNGLGIGWGNGWGGASDVYTSSTYVIRPRTPLTTNFLSNSNYNGTQLITNKEIREENNRDRDANRQNWDNQTRSTNDSFWNSHNSNNNSRSNSNWGSQQPSNSGRSNMGSSRPSTTRSSSRPPSSSRRSSSGRSGGRR